MKSKFLIFIVLFLSLGTLSATVYGKSKGLFCKKYKVRVDSLEAKVKADSTAICKYKNKCDSLSLEIDSYKRQISVLDSKINRDTLLKKVQRLEANQGFVDTCMVKLANRWLYEPFSKKDVDEAISYFDRIYSKDLKSSLSIVQKLLKNYEVSYEEFQSILKEAQLDVSREEPFDDGGEFKKKYRNKIRGMSYFKEYYNSAWNIRYLNEQIRRALDLLDRHTSKKPADFRPLIDSNRVN